MEELLKCLHCGGKAQMRSHIVFENRGEDYRKHWNGDKYYVQCESCEIRTPDCYTEQEAFNAWNRRAQPEQPEAAHGRWQRNTDDFTPAKRCSICGHNKPIAAGESISREPENYCPNCGAKMDGARRKGNTNG